MESSSSSFSYDIQGMNSIHTDNIANMSNNELITYLNEITNDVLKRKKEEEEKEKAKKKAAEKKKRLKNFNERRSSS